MAENCEHCTPTRPDQLTRHRRAFIELERERDALRAEVERLKAVLYDTLGSLHVIDYHAGMITRWYGKKNSHPVQWAKEILEKRDEAHQRICDAMPLPSMPTGESEAGE